RRRAGGASPRPGREPAIRSHPHTLRRCLPRRGLRSVGRLLDALPLGLHLHRLLRIGPPPHQLPRTPIHPGATTSPVLAAGEAFGSESTNSVAPAATPAIPMTNPTLATVCCVLPEEISPVLSGGHGPPWHALFRSLYVERAMTPVMAKVTSPA